MALLTKPRIKKSVAVLTSQLDGDVWIFGTGHYLLLLSKVGNGDASVEYFFRTLKAHL